MRHFHIKIKDGGRSEETFVNFAWALARCSVWAMMTGFVDAYKPILCEEVHDSIQSRTVTGSVPLRTDTPASQPGTEG